MISGSFYTYQRNISPTEMLRFLWYFVWGLHVTAATYLLVWIMLLRYCCLFICLSSRLLYHICVWQWYVAVCVSRLTVGSTAVFTSGLSSLTTLTVSWTHDSLPTNSPPSPSTWCLLSSDLEGHLKVALSNTGDTCSRNLHQKLARKFDTSSSQFLAPIQLSGQSRCTVCVTCRTVSVME